MKFYTQLDIRVFQNSSSRRIHELVMSKVHMVNVIKWPLLLYCAYVCLRSILIQNDLVAVSRQPAAQAQPVGLAVCCSSLGLGLCNGVSRYDDELHRMKSNDTPSYHVGCSARLIDCAVSASSSGQTLVIRDRLGTLQWRSHHVMGQVRDAKHDWLRH